MKWQPSSIPPGARPLLSTKFRLLCSNDAFLSLPHRWLIWWIFPLQTECSFPARFKLGHVIPLIKKAGSDVQDPSNYRPITNLVTISKIPRGWFWFASDLMWSCQSSSVHFSRHTDGGTSLRLIYSESSMIWILARSRVPRVFSFRWASRLHSLQTTQTNYILQRLKSDCSIGGFASAWLRSCLTGRSCYVAMGDHKSDVWSCDSDVPLVSLLGPILFSAFVSPISRIMEATGIKYHQYADDTQLYTEVRSLDSTQT